MFIWHWVVYVHTVLEPRRSNLEGFVFRDTLVLETYEYACPWP